MIERRFLVGFVLSLVAVPMTALADDPTPADPPPADPYPDLPPPDPVAPDPYAAAPAAPTPASGEPTPREPIEPVAPTREKDEAHGKKKKPFEWNPKWPTIQKYEYGLTAAYAVTAVVGALAIPGSAKWTGTNAFDTAARNALRITDANGSQIARDTSDVALTILVNHRLIDDIFVAWWARQHPKIAWQLTVMDAETLAFTTSVNTLVAGLAGRQRPYVAQICGEKELQDTSDCNGSNRYRSYFSGHTTAAFTLAGLTCIHHAELPLYGNGVADAFACVGAMATATTVGFMRVAADQHYMTDVITGAAFGTLAGVGMPWLLHYRGSPRLAADTKGSSVLPPPVFIATPTGVQLLGAF